MNAQKEEYYKVYGFCLSQNIPVSTSQKAAKYFIENLEGNHNLEKEICTHLKKVISSLLKKPYKT